MMVASVAGWAGVAVCGALLAVLAGFVVHFVRGLSRDGRSREGRAGEGQGGRPPRRRPPGGSPR